MSNSLDNLTVFFGDASNAEVRVYARIPRDAALEGCRLSGHVIGPFNAFNQTLPAKLPLVDRGPGPALLAEAIVPDPCSWSPDAPFLYRVDVELWRDNELLASANRDLGIRPLGVVGKVLVLAGRRWIVRAASQQLMPTASLGDWQRAGLAMAVAELSSDREQDAWFGDAGRLGVPLIVRLQGNDSELLLGLQMLSRWPAVMIVVLPSGTNVDAVVRSAAPNILLAEHFGPDETLLPSPWASIVICEGRTIAEFAERSATCSRPIIAYRPTSTVADMGEIRAACDELERDLAGRGDFAGLIV